MTPAEMLAPQPAPARSDRSESVTDWLLDRIDGSQPGSGPLMQLLIRRRAQGIERYGQELLTHDGRDPNVDALQEAVDLLIYLAKAEMEHPTGWPEEMGATIETVLRLVHRLEQS